MSSAKETRSYTHGNSDLFASEKVESIASFNLFDPSHRSSNLSQVEGNFVPEKQS